MVSLLPGAGRAARQDFRIGHMGWSDEGDVYEILGSLESALLDFRLIDTPGVCVGAAMGALRGRIENSIGEAAFAE